MKRKISGIMIEALRIIRALGEVLFMEIPQEFMNKMSHNFRDRDLGKILIILLKFKEGNLQKRKRKRLKYLGLLARLTLAGIIIMKISNLEMNN
jgi:hypothetical protein